MAEMTKQDAHQVQVLLHWVLLLDDRSTYPDHEVHAAARELAGRAHTTLGPGPSARTVDRGWEVQRPYIPRDGVWSVRVDPETLRADHADRLAGLTDKVLRRAALATWIGDHSEPSDLAAVRTEVVEKARELARTDRAVTR